MPPAIAPSPRPRRSLRSVVYGLDQLVALAITGPTVALRFSSQIPGAARYQYSQLRADGSLEIFFEHDSFDPVDHQQPVPSTPLKILFSPDLAGDAARPKPALADFIRGPHHLRGSTRR